MPGFERELSEWLAAHHGVVGMGQLRAIGLSPEQVRRLLRSGRLNRHRIGVYVAASAPATREQRLAVLCLAGGGVISVAAAGRVWGFRKLGAISVIDVTIKHGRRLRYTDEDVRIRHSSDLTPMDIVRRRDGITVTSPPRTVFDLASVLSGDDLESVVEQGLHQKLFTFPTLQGVGRRLAGPGRDGSANFASVLARRPAWRRPAASDLEVVLCRALEAAGMPSLQRAHAVRFIGGEVVHPDLVEVGARIVIEVDHVSWHGGRLDNMYDRWRDRRYHRVGWHTERVSDDAIMQDLDRTVSELMEVHRSLVSTGGLGDPLRSRKLG